MLRDLTIGVGQAPPCGDTGYASREVVGGFRQAHRRHTGRHFGWSGQFQQSDVISEREHVEIAVLENLSEKQQHSETWCYPGDPTLTRDHCTGPSQTRSSPTDPQRPEMTSPGPTETNSTNTGLKQKTRLPQQDPRVTRSTDSKTRGGQFYHH